MECSTVLMLCQQQLSIEALLTHIHSRCRAISFPLHYRQKGNQGVYCFTLGFEPILFPLSVDVLSLEGKKRRESRAAQRNFAVYLGEIQNCFLPSRAENQLSKYSDVHKLYYKESSEEHASFMLRNRQYLSFLE